MRVVKHWKRLPIDGDRWPFCGNIKGQVDSALSNQI